ncbi:type III-B CRISPR module RAMP protein Cmr4 [Desulfosarcina ovata subsp. sediminis]|uniref:Type III-B CRISPR module RAMP protein Cmr4 n=1 Tax=Desulfosarcina ovata subsp. sediminis TaxID=885957 RepID=A0A5K7ZN23_9BACT|nr:type III-B CRISPR module RAMP protein Cmr4 [Desulfosarcina ovata]BBO79930.1 type III-B CRISPR module RAMP protein Cmr4 [Desulfosarcina ovata subsp. sediminis]
MIQKNSAILGLLAQTSIHAGTGQQIGFIDLPIQREGHSGWPCIFGSSVKGALRTNAEQKKIEYLKSNGTVIQTQEEYAEKVQNSEDIAVVFGPSTNNASDHAGALIVSDAKLLLMPVRSLTSHFKWVTCPYGLTRYQQDCLRLGIAGQSFKVPPVNDSEALVHVTATEDSLFLEEYRFQTKRIDFNQGPIKALSNLMTMENATDLLRTQLVLVSNNSFVHLVNHTTPVNAHIAIETQTKTVKEGALWYEETLPPETLLYVSLFANDARNGNSSMPAETILGMATNLFSERPWLQVGGNETVGMGWCGVKTLSQEGV